MYTQGPLLELIRTGKAFGETESPKKHIETVVSNVFVFSEHTYKVYKNDNDFFNTGFRDISGKEARFDFTRRDFEWNRTLNSDVYIALRPVSVVNGELCVVNDEAAEEYVMVMNTFPEESVLINVFLRGVPEDLDPFKEGRRFAELRQDLPNLPKDHLDPLARSAQLCDDVYNWALMQKDKLEDGELETYCQFLKKLVAEDQSVSGYFRDHLSVSMDIHMGNALYHRGKLMLIDTFSPKESWFIKHECCDLYRLGTDIRVFMGEKAWDLFKDGYYSVSSEEPCHPGMDVFSTIYASLIMVSYLFYLGGGHAGQAEKHLSFLRNYFQELQ